MSKAALRTASLSWMTSLALLFTTASAEGEDICRNATLGTMQARLCRDAELLQLDRDLNQVYGLVLRVSQQPEQLRQAQRAWLRVQRGQCHSNECLFPIYRKRIAELADFFAGSMQISEAALSDTEAKSTCRELAALADEDELSRLAVPGISWWWFGDKSGMEGWTFTDEEKEKTKSLDLFAMEQPNTIYKLRINQGAPIRFGKFFQSGTCKVEETYSIPGLLSTGESRQDPTFDMVPDPDELIRWAIWGGTEYPIFYHNKVFLLAAQSPNPNRLTMVSWVKPDGKKRPICLLDARLTGQLKKGPTSQPEVCSKIERGTLKPMQWENVSDRLPIQQNSETYREDFITRYKEYADSVELLRTDINGDGKTESIGRFTYESGAGCGSTNTWLSLLSSDLGKIESNPTNELINSAESWSIEIYKHNRRHYISVATKDGNGHLLHIGKGQLEKVCNLQQKTQTSPTQFFPLGAQPGRVD